MASSEAKREREEAANGDAAAAADAKKQKVEGEAASVEGENVAKDDEEMSDDKIEKAQEGAVDVKEGEGAAAESEKTVGAAEVEKADAEADEDAGKKEVQLGPVMFHSSAQMYRFFYELLHAWAEDHNMNKYEHMVLLDLLQLGHSNPEAKIGCGVAAFQVRLHPVYPSRCYYLIRTDGTFDDFSYRKCVNKVMDLLPGEDPTGRGGRGGGGRSSRGGGFRGRGGGGFRGRGRGRGRGRD